MFERVFTNFANAIARWAGSPAVFLVGCAAVIVWALSGPLFHFDNTWQLLINTSTTIVTFLMVLLIQNTQNRDNAALQAKLDELIRASKSRNHFIGLEHQTETEISHIRQEVEHHAEHIDDEALRTERVARAAEKKATQARDKASRAEDAANAAKAAAKRKPS